MKITFIGDAHGEWTKLFARIDRHINHNPVIQVGDLGVGFGEKKKYFHKDFHFIHGNHDNPALCKAAYEYHFLGRYGYVKHWNLFFVSGAWSIDKDNRVPFVSWWPTEELGWAECQEVLELWNKLKPDYIVTHDCPDDISRMILRGAGKYPTRTGQLFTQMFQDHKPKLWIFGHYHESFDKEIMGTRFICLNILEEKTLEIECSPKLVVPSPSLVESTTSLSPTIVLPTTIQIPSGE